MSLFHKLYTRPVPYMSEMKLSCVLFLIHGAVYFVLLEAVKCITNACTLDNLTLRFNTVDLYYDTANPSLAAVPAHLEGNHVIPRSLLLEGISHRHAS